jgi:hypothetical protein
VSCDTRSEIASLRHIAIVSEPLHQLGPGFGRSCERPAGALWLVRKSKSGQRGTITWKASLALPPWAMGEVSGPITFENSRTEPGQSCVSISGNARSSCRNTPLT